MYTEYVKKMEKLYQTTITQVNTNKPDYYGFIAKVIDECDKEGIGIGEASSIIEASEMALERAFKVYFGEDLDEIKKPTKESVKESVKDESKAEKETEKETENPNTENVTEKRGPGRPRNDGLPPQPSKKEPKDKPADFKLSVISMLSGQMASEICNTWDEPLVKGGKDSVHAYVANLLTRYSTSGTTPFAVELRNLRDYVKALGKEI